MSLINSFTMSVTETMTLIPNFLTPEFSFNFQDYTASHFLLAKLVEEVCLDCSSSSYLPCPFLPCSYPHFLPSPTFLPSVPSQIFPSHTPDPSFFLYLLPSLQPSSVLLGMWFLSLVTKRILHLSFSLVQ